MASSSARRQRARRQAEESQTQRAPATTRRLPVYRSMLVLPLLAFLVALFGQIILKAAGADSDSPLRIFLTPLIGAGVVLVGMRRYPVASRIRTAAMVAIALFVFALVT
ncbi:MAG TPA: hypothetical protein VFB90_00950 [Dehalococcoidia bacterium]|nr:hypothetical protein [Dehalococcoidia bacterium]